MPDVVTASTVARFAGHGSIALSIEPDPGVYSDGLVHLLLHPAIEPIGVYTNVGEVRRGDAKPVTVPGGIVRFGGSALASLPKRPVYSTPDFETLFAFDLEGLPTGISLSYDGEANALSAGKDCHAAVKYSSYVSESRRLTYAPKVTPLRTGTRVEYGVIAAFHAPTKSMVVYEVPSPEAGADTTDVELYRIVSQVVTTPDGEFEKPPGYPASGVYPDLAPSTTIDVSVALLTERAHEIGFMTPNGTAYVRTYFQPVLEPYVGSSTYKRKTVCRVSPLGDQYPQELRLRALSYIKSRNLGCDR